jgi:GTP pyrophosphokinase
MQVLANEKLNIINVNTASDKSEHVADMRLTIEASNLNELGRVLSKINQLPNVVEVRRTYSS